MRTIGELKILSPSLQEGGRLHTGQITIPVLLIALVIFVAGFIVVIDYRLTAFVRAAFMSSAALSNAARIARVNFSC